MPELPHIPMPRLLGWIVVSILLTLAVALIAPQQVPVSLYKLNLIALAGVAGYWLDRALFPYARPDRFVDKVRRDRDDLCSAGLAMASMLRRAVVVAAAMVAVGLGA